MADVTAGIVTALVDLGADVHVALPNYRQVFNVDVEEFASRTLREYRSRLQGRRIHLAEDSAFYYQSSVYTGDVATTSLRFQRELLNNILGEVDPDLIHCNDWMTGLIPAMSRRLEIPCLFTVHNIHSWGATLDEIEESGIAVRDFWTNLYFNHMPGTYEETRATNSADLLVSGIFASHFVNTVSPTFLDEIIDGVHDFVPGAVRTEMRNKANEKCAAGILNAPPTQYHPETDEMLAQRYSADTLVQGKATNKAAFQAELGLPVDAGAPIFFWPSRLDPMQKGCELLIEVLPQIVRDYRKEHLQVAIIADGTDFDTVRRTIAETGIAKVVALRPFSERLSRLGFSASDFTLMPSRFEPCGLPQMIGAIYGSLPIVHRTGGLRDTVAQLETDKNTGNGFLFDTYGADGFAAAIDEAMKFHLLPGAVHTAQMGRIMIESAKRFSHGATAKEYFALYERMLERPVVTTEGEEE